MLGWGFELDEYFVFLELTFAASVAELAPSRVTELGVLGHGMAEELQARRVHGLGFLYSSSGESQKNCACSAASGAGLCDGGRRESRSILKLWFPGVFKNA